MKKLIVYRRIGMCPGVKRSIRETLEHGKEKPSVFGQLLHNPEVSRMLEDAGIGVYHKLEEAPLGRLNIIRAHGIPPEEEEFLKKKGCVYLDLTCRTVKKLQNKVASYRKKGLRIFIAGNPVHPETRGLMGYAGSRGMVLSTPEEAGEVEPFSAPGVLLAQTTTSGELFDQIADQLKLRGKELVIEKSICPFVTSSQEWTSRTAGECEVFLVVGGNNSSNTKKLFALAASRTRAVHVETAEDPRIKELFSFSSVGFNAGTSTLEKTTKEVIERFKAAGFKIVFS